MVDSLTFTVDIVQTIGDRLANKTMELGFASEAETSFEEWLAWEGYFACKSRQPNYPFFEVAFQPTYASEGVSTDNSSVRSTGDLRVGGPDQGANHCWAFIEFALLDDANHASEETSCKLKSAVERLKRLGWKKSAALLIVVAVSRGDLQKNWADTLATYEVWNQSPVTQPRVIALPNGGTAVLKAFDIKLDPSHVLTEWSAS